MNNFTYYTPTKVVFGRGSEGQTGALVRERGCKKVLLHYGGGSAVRSGLLDRVKDSLREAGLEWTELGGALPNPRLSLVLSLIHICLALTARQMLSDAAALLDRVVPVNLTVDLSLRYNQHQTLLGRTHAALAAYTHDQLRNEVLANGG